MRKLCCLALLALAYVLPLSAHADLGLRDLWDMAGQAEKAGQQVKPGTTPYDSRVPKGPAERERRIETLRKALHDLQLYWSMSQFNAYTHDKHCAEQFGIVKQWYEKAEWLDSKYKNNPTEDYQKQMREAKEQNKMAREEFEKCFTSTIRISNLQDLNEVGATDYASFQAAFAKFNQRFGNKDTEALAKKYNDELELLASTEGDSNVVGLVTSTFKQTEVLRGGQWVPLKEGMTVYIPDEIRTGPQGRVRIELRDRIEKGNRGPTIVNVGSGSHVKLMKFDVSFDDPVVRIGLLDVLRGTVRAFTRNWGERSVFSVRTGTSLCGIRGTDLIVKYDPTQDKTDYYLDHGKVEIVPKKGEKFYIIDDQMVRVEKGEAAEVKPMDASTWQAGLDETSSSQTPTHETAKDKPFDTSQLPSLGKTLQGITYVGCYKDKGIPFVTWWRDLGERRSSDKTLTQCLAGCKVNGYAYAGAQNGHQCFCGYSYGRYGELDESDCNMPCKDQPESICGGRGANSIYKLD